MTVQCDTSTMCIYIYTGIHLYLLLYIYTRIYIYCELYTYIHTVNYIHTFNIYMYIYFYHHFSTHTQSSLACDTRSAGPSNRQHRKAPSQLLVANIKGSPTIKCGYHIIHNIGKQDGDMVIYDIYIIYIYNIQSYIILEN